MKHIKLGILVLSSLYLMRCAESKRTWQEKNETTLKNDEALFVDSLHFHFSRLATIGDAELQNSVGHLNEKIYQLFEEATDRFSITKIDSLLEKKDILSIEISKDKKLAVASWDSRMGGSMIAYKSE